MKLVVGTFLSVDGVMQAPGGPDEDRSGGFAHGGWMFPYFDDTLQARMIDWIGRAEALLLGRRTYEIFAAYWPHVTDPADAIAATFNRIPKHVASRTLDRLAWHNARLLPDDTVAAIAELKRQPGGELQVHGSGELVRTLLAHDLVDELRLWTAPLVLGAGKRLFGTDARPAALHLAETLATGTGAVFHAYRRAGEVAHGSFAMEHPSPDELERRRKIETE